MRHYFYEASMVQRHHDLLREAAEYRWGKAAMAASNPHAHQGRFVALRHWFRLLRHIDAPVDPDQTASLQQCREPACMGKTAASSSNVS